MKKIFAIFLLTAYLFSVTDIKELLKLNVVLEHLHEHQEKDKSISLFDFLMMHYVTDDRNSDDDSRDESLPFKSNNIRTTISSFVSLPAKKIQYNFQPFSYVRKNSSCVKTICVLTNFYTSIWHPPQL